MKKVLVVLAAAGLLFSMTSCDKKCTCTANVIGITASTEVNLNDFKNDNIKRCSDLGKANVAGLAGYECK